MSDFVPKLASQPFFYYNDRLSMKNDNDIFLAMSGYALINIDEFDAMSKSQQPILK